MQKFPSIPKTERTKSKFIQKAPYKLDFIVDRPKKYNPLKDKFLATHFSKDQKFKLLRRQALINKNGSLVTNPQKVLWGRKKKQQAYTIRNRSVSKLRQREAKWYKRVEYGSLQLSEFKKPQPKTIKSKTKRRRRRILNKLSKKVEKQLQNLYNYKQIPKKYFKPKTTKKKVKPQVQQEPAPPSRRRQKEEVYHKQVPAFMRSIKKLQKAITTKLLPQIRLKLMQKRRNTEERLKQEKQAKTAVKSKMVKQ